MSTAAWAVLVELKTLLLLSLILGGRVCALFAL